MVEDDFQACRVELVNLLSDLSREQLHLIVSDVLRPYRRINHKVGVVDEAHCLVTVSAELNGSPPYLQLWAFPKVSGEGIPYVSDYKEGDRRYDVAPDSGRCNRCGVDVSSVGGGAICPICENDIECT